MRSEKFDRSGPVWVPEGCARRHDGRPDVGRRHDETAPHARPGSIAKSVFLADKPDGLRRVLLRQAAKADGALALDLQAVAANEGFFPVRVLHERAIGALVDEHELTSTDLDAGVETGNQVSLDHHVVILRPSNRDAGMLLVNDELAVVCADAQTQEADRARVH